MKKSIILMAVIAFIGFGQNAQAAQSSGSSVTTPQTPTQENPAVQNSEQNFNKARESFLKKEYKAAAEDIRKSVKYMKTEESHATAAGKKMLTASINELDTLAKDVEKGSVTSVNALDNAFTRARDAIASNAHVKSAETKAGEAAKDTSSGIKRGLSWTGEKIGEAASGVAKGTGFVVGKAIEGTGWLGRHTGSMLNSASSKVEDFGKDMQPKKQEYQTQKNEPVSKE
jgi:hypothetical protein